MSDDEVVASDVPPQYLLFRHQAVFVLIDLFLCGLYGVWLPLLLNTSISVVLHRLKGK